MRNSLFPKPGEWCFVFDNQGHRQVPFDGREYIELVKQEELAVEETLPAIQTISSKIDMLPTAKYKRHQVNNGNISIIFYYRENMPLDINKVWNILELYYLQAVPFSRLVNKSVE